MEKLHLYERQNIENVRKQYSTAISMSSTPASEHGSSGWKP
jgi:hypothetical protein